MRNPGGCGFLTGPEGVTEVETYTCAHCNCVRQVRPRENPEDTGGLCKQCMKLVCPRCAHVGTCTPFEKKLEAWEARGRALRSYGL